MAGTAPEQVAALALEVLALRRELVELRREIRTEVRTRRLVVLDRHGRARIVAGDGCEGGAVSLRLDDGHHDAAVELYAGGVDHTAGLAAFLDGAVVVDVFANGQRTSGSDRRGPRGVALVQNQAGDRHVEIDPQNVIVLGPHGANASMSVHDDAVTVSVTSRDDCSDLKGSASAAIVAEEAWAELDHAEPAHALLRLDVDGLGGRDHWVVDGSCRAPGWRP